MKSSATLEDYMALGADFRLLKAIITKIMCNQKMLISETNNMGKPVQMIYDVISEQEDKMLDTYPELSNKYLRVFYGPLDKKPEEGNEIDKAVIELAKQTAENLFK